MAALFARHGFTASKRALEAPRGLMQVFSDKADWREITDGLGERWESALNTYKPFACGIVIHPSIDGCIQLRERHHLKPEQIARVVLHVHPLVLELTGKRTPTKGLEGKFSVYHSCAAGLIFGRAGEHEYSDEVVQLPAVIALRDKVTAVPDGAMAEASCRIEIELVDGTRHSIEIEHAVGSVEKPMNDAALRAKFVDQAVPILGERQAAEAADAAFAIAKAPDMKRLLAACTPAALREAAR
jgi:2-methylcitrate dehydratase PrpD